MLAIVAESCLPRYSRESRDEREVYAEAFHLNDTNWTLLVALFTRRDAHSQSADIKKVRLNVDSVSYWMATNNARDNSRARLLRSLRYSRRLRHLAKIIRSASHTGRISSYHQR